MRKIQNEKSYYDLGKSPHIDSVAKLVGLLDGYLAYFFDDPDPYDKWIKQGALGRAFATEWKKNETYSTLYKIANSIKEIPGLQKYVSIQGALRSLSLVFTIFASTMVMASLFLEIPLVLLGAFAIASIGSITLIGSWIAGKKVADNIDNYFKAHQEKYKFKKASLRNMAQKLIFSLAYYLQKKEIKLESYKFKLFNANYKGLRVLKKPKLFRKRYIVTFNPQNIPL
ncbi:MAG: hypothetical protein ACFFCW_35260 [Candidatus Hodarchaeota archaeon]